MDVETIPTYIYVRYRSKCRSFDPVETALGVALDRAITRYNYYQSKTPRSLLGKALRHCIAVFKEELLRQGVSVEKELFREYVRRLWMMLVAWSKTRYVNLPRPRTHVIIFKKDNKLYGVYAQLDFFEYKNGKPHYYELKSFDIWSGCRDYVWIQACVFRLLGPLTIIYYKRDNNGYYHIETQDIEPDYSIIDDIVSFIENTRYSKTEDIEEIKYYHPVIIYEWIENKWCLANKL